MGSLYVTTTNNRAIEILHMKELEQFLLAHDLVNRKKAVVALAVLLKLFRSTLTEQRMHALGQKFITTASLVPRLFSRTQERDGPPAEEDSESRTKKKKGPKEGSTKAPEAIAQKAAECHGVLRT